MIKMIFALQIAVLSSSVAFGLPLSSGFLKLKSSIYYIQTIEIDQDCLVKKTVLNTKGHPLYKVCKQDYKRCVIEGTCAFVEPSPDDATEVVDKGIEFLFTESGVELINYVKSDKNGSPLFETVDTARCPYGLGVSNICLDPYYSIAADLDYKKPGDVIFIPQLKGLKLLNGEIHPGFMIVRDRGGAIKGAHRFDFYTGYNHYTKDQNPFSDIGLAMSKSNFEYRKATSQEAAAFKKLRNYPLVPESVLK